MAIWLVQLLCPARHAIGAVPYDPANVARPAIEAVMAHELLLAGVDSWCGLCGSHDLRFEHGQTSYATLEEALPHLREIEAKNMMTRAMLLREQGKAT